MGLKETANSTDLEYGGYAKEQEVTTLENVEPSDNHNAAEIDPHSLNAGLQRGLKDRRKHFLCFHARIYNAYS
jgi:hypothetical protein